MTALVLAGYCCIEYTVCPDDNSFSLYIEANPGMSMTDSVCTQDYIIIEGT